MVAIRFYIKGIPFVCGTAELNWSGKIVKDWPDYFALFILN